MLLQLLIVILIDFFLAAGPSGLGETQRPHDKILPFVEGPTAKNHLSDPPPPPRPP